MRQLIHRRALRMEPPTKPFHKRCSPSGIRKPQNHQASTHPKPSAHPMRRDGPGSSVGRASDRRSEGLRFDPGSGQCRRAFDPAMEVHMRQLIHRRALRMEPPTKPFSKRCSPSGIRKPQNHQASTPTKPSAHPMRRGRPDSSVLEVRRFSPESGQCL